MKLSLCITTFNRYDLLKESYAQVIDDPRISEIIIVDDCSTEPGIKEKVNNLAGGNVKVFHQAQNRGMSMNKRDAIAYASNPWVIIFDSDNIIGPDYLDAFYLGIKRFPTEEDGSPASNVIFCPSYAKPNFNYQEYEGWTLISDDANDWMKFDLLNTCMNTCNYIVNRDHYLKTYQYNPAHIASDTIWHSFNHLKAGGLFHIVPEMHYYHRVHPGSGFLQGVDHNMRMQNEVRKMIMAL
jgi:glycosyltransferase involved in cell wall biosynthesis